VLAKLDYQFPETESVKLHQLLDPETKDLLPRQEASRVLEDASKFAASRLNIKRHYAQLQLWAFDVHCIALSRGQRIMRSFSQTGL